MIKDNIANGSHDLNGNIQLGNNRVSDNSIKPPSIVIDTAKEPKEPKESTGLLTKIAPLLTLRYNVMI